MAIWSPDDNHYLIVLPTTTGVPIGTVVYLQNGVYGTPLGLLLSFTMTPTYKKVLTTSHGFISISS